MQNQFPSLNYGGGKQKSKKFVSLSLTTSRDHGIHILDLSILSLNILFL